MRCKKISFDCIMYFCFPKNKKGWLCVDLLLLLLLSKSTTKYDFFFWRKGKNNRNLNGRTKIEHRKKLNKVKKLKTKYKETNNIELLANLIFLNIFNKVNWKMNTLCNLKTIGGAQLSIEIFYDYLDFQHLSCNFKSTYS